MRRRACWSCRPRCSPTGRRKPSASPRRCGCWSRIRPFGVRPTEERWRPPSLADDRSRRDHLRHRCRGSAGSPATHWRLAVLDEAQAIKNPARQADPRRQGAARRSRIALTGTPVENQLAGSVVALRFPQSRPAGLGQGIRRASSSGCAAQEPVSYAPLRKLVAPYILRRLKTDRSVIADLPDKTEVKAFCHSHARSRRRCTRRRSTTCAKQLAGTTDGIAQRGLVLASLMRLKQICNHPAQWLGHGGLRRSGQRQVPAAWRARREPSPAAGKAAGLHAVPRDHRAAGARSWPASSAGRAWCSTAARAVAKRRELVEEFQSDERAAVLRAVAQGRRHRAEPDGRLARHPLRPLVEPGRREPGDRPRLPHRAEAQRAGPQIRLPWDDRGANRRVDRIEATDDPGFARRMAAARSTLTEMSDRELLALGAARSRCGDERGLMAMSVSGIISRTSRSPNAGAGGARGREAQEDGRGVARRHRGPQDRQELLGQGLVRQSGALLRLCQTACRAGEPMSATAR